MRCPGPRQGTTHALDLRARYTTTARAVAIAVLAPVAILEVRVHVGASVRVALTAAEAANALSAGAAVALLSKAALARLEPARDGLVRRAKVGREPSLLAVQ